MSPSIEFDTDYHCSVGKLEPVAPGLRRITANNPGPLTFRGTGTYIIGQGAVAVIDPGPGDPAHIKALMAGLEGETVSHILVTHTHRDHSEASRMLQERCDAPIYSLGTHTALQRVSKLPEELDDAGDTDFVPDVVLGDGERIIGDGWSLQCLHTPGHASNHACFAQDDHERLFVGDLVMGWSTPVLLPPDGHLEDYLSSLRRVLERTDTHYWPTHGAPIENPKPFVEQLIAHRLARIDDVLDAVRRGHLTLDAIVADAYPGLDKRLEAAAMRSVLASVVYLIDRGQLSGNLSLGLDISLATG